MTTVMSAPSAGAETITRFAPASRCFAAASRLVKFPVHSSTTSTPRLRQGSCAGSRSAVTAILPRPISIQLSPAVTSPGKRPCTLSYLSRWALVATGPRSLIATTSTSSHLLSCAARRAIRPVRPKPLIATRTAMVCSFNWNYHGRFDPPARQRIDLCHTISAMFETTSLDADVSSAVARAPCDNILFFGAAPLIVRLHPDGLWYPTTPAHWRRAESDEIAADRGKAVERDRGNAAGIGARRQKIERVADREIERQVVGVTAV